MLAVLLLTFLAVFAETIPGITCDDQPLLLTPYLEENKIEEAREESKVKTDIIPLSYSGFLTVDKKLGNHLFFWFFPSEENPEAPLLLWLQGGPTESSMIGILSENGPIEIVKADDVNDIEYKKRDITWVGEFSVLYVDQPVGVGYSYSDKGKDGYKATPEGYTEDMFSFVRQFFKMFPEYLTREFYIGGVSYAGHYVSNLAHRIHVEREAGAIDIPLTGIYLGAALYAPETQLAAIFDEIYTFGIISEADFVKYKAAALDLYQRGQKGDFLHESLATVIELFMPLSVAMSVDSLNNYVTGKSPDDMGVTNVMSSSDIRKLIHVGSQLEYQAFNFEVYNIYGHDFLQSETSKMAALMDNYKVLYYTGDYDLTVSNMMAEAAIHSTPWSHQAEYNAASRLLWDRRTSRGQRYGFYSRTDNLCRVVIHGAGHSVAQDQPEIALQMMKDFVQHGCIQAA